MADANEVALLAGDTTPLLIAAYGPRVFAEQAGVVDRRLGRAADMAQIVELFARQAQLGVGQLPRGHAPAGRGTHADPPCQLRCRPASTRPLELTTASSATLDFPAIFRRLVEALRARLDAHVVSVLQIDPGATHVLVRDAGCSTRCRTRRAAIR